VADYRGIHPMFGTMADFDRLVAETHARGMKLILDFVPNHTSEEHPWFRESRSSRDNPKRDWYIWRDSAPDGGPPNNWLASFGGSGWERDGNTGQYYYHAFLKEQPDLNWRNPEVREAMLEVMRFWLDKGVDGFRVDVIWMMIKDELLRDEELNPDWDGVNPHNRIKHNYTHNQPEVHDLIREMRKVLDAYDERMMVGEIYLPNDSLMQYYGRDLDECHLPFNFQLILAPWKASIVRKLVDEYEAVLPEGGWPNWVLGNHDQHRLATRIGPAQARVANMLLLTLRGTPTCYYGDEIGMEDVAIPPHMIQDPPAVKQPEIAHIVGRDPERTPMQWDDSPNAGFAPAGVETWLPVAPDYKIRNVAAQDAGPSSMLNYFRALTALRQSEPALITGSYRSVEAGAGDVFAYVREGDGAALLVVLNLGGEAHQLDLSAVAPRAELVMSTIRQPAGSRELAHLALAANEGLILRLAA
jgi:alpha-glucosidase